MADVVLVAACSHSPYLYTSPELWDEGRRRRRIHPDVPIDPPEVNEAKHAQCMKAFATLREKVEAVKPDVLLVFGDDQYEQFNFSNFPAFGLYIGEEVAGTHPEVYGPRILLRDFETPERTVKAPGHPELGKRLAEALFERDFDLAFSLERPNKERGIGHAFINPSFYLDPAYDIPIVPFWVNCYFPPQPTGKRCYRLGKAVREALADVPLDVRVAVVASGGLWHTPGMPNQLLDENFDQGILQRLRAGDALSLADFFDETPWQYPAEPPPGELRGMMGWTGMTGGPGSGTGETRNWLIAAAVVDGMAPTFLDYVPVYASPCGMGFAYWDL